MKQNGASSGRIWSETRSAPRAKVVPTLGAQIVERSGPVTLRPLVGVRTRTWAGVREGRSAQGPAYTLPGEPMTERPILDAEGRPRSVWSALLTLDRSAYVQLVQLAFPSCTSAADARLVLVDTLLSEATHLGRWELQGSSHWLVWLTREGSARVQVWP